MTVGPRFAYAYGASVEDALHKHQYDLYYVKNNSLFLDLLILFGNRERGAVRGARATCCPLLARKSPKHPAGLILPASQMRESGFSHYGSFSLPPCP